MNIVTEITEIEITEIIYHTALGHSTQHNNNNNNNTNTAQKRVVFLLYLLGCIIAAIYLISSHQLSVHQCPSHSTSVFQSQFRLSLVLVSVQL